MAPDVRSNDQNIVQNQYSQEAIVAKQKLNQPQIVIRGASPPTISPTQQPRAIPDYSTERNNIDTTPDSPEDINYVEELLSLGIVSPEYASSYRTTATENIASEREYNIKVADATQQVALIDPKPDTQSDIDYVSGLFQKGYIGEADFTAYKSVAEQNIASAKQSDVDNAAIAMWNRNPSIEMLGILQGFSGERKVSAATITEIYGSYESGQRQVANDQAAVDRFTISPTRGTLETLLLETIGTPKAVSNATLESMTAAVNQNEINTRKSEELNIYFNKVALGEDRPLDVNLWAASNERTTEYGYAYDGKGYHFGSSQRGYELSNEEFIQGVKSNLKLGVDDRITLNGQVIQESNLSHEQNLTVGDRAVSAYDYAKELAGMAESNRLAAYNAQHPDFGGFFAVAAGGITAEKVAYYSIPTTVAINKPIGIDAMKISELNAAQIRAGILIPADPLTTIISPNPNPIELPIKSVLFGNSLFSAYPGLPEFSSGETNNQLVKGINLSSQVIEAMKTPQHGSIAEKASYFDRQDVQSFINKPLTVLSTFLASPDVMKKQVANIYEETIGKSLYNAPESKNPAALKNVMRSIGFDTTPFDILQSREVLNQARLDEIYNIKQTRDEQGILKGVFTKTIEHPFVQTAAMAIPFGAALKGSSMLLKGAAYVASTAEGIGIGGKVLAGGLILTEKVISNPYVQLFIFMKEPIKDIANSKTFGEGFGKTLVLGASIPFASVGFKVGEGLVTKVSAKVGITNEKVFGYSGGLAIPFMSRGHAVETIFENPTITGASARRFGEFGEQGIRSPTSTEPTSEHPGSFMTIGSEFMNPYGKFFETKAFPQLLKDIFNSARASGKGIAKSVFETIDAKIQFESNRLFVQPIVNVQTVDTVRLPKELKTQIYESLATKGSAIEFQSSVEHIAYEQSRATNRPVAIPSPKRFAGEMLPENEVYLIYGSKAARKITGTFGGFTASTTAVVRKTQLGESKTKNSVTSVLPTTPNYIVENIIYNVNRDSNYLQEMAIHANRKIGEEAGTLFSVKGEYGTHGKSHATEVTELMQGFTQTNKGLSKFTTKDITDAGKYHDIAKIAEQETRPFVHSEASARMLEKGLLKGVTASKSTIKAIREHTEIQPLKALVLHPIQTIKTVFKRPTELSKSLATADRMTLKTRFGTEVNPAQLFNMNVKENVKSIKVDSSNIPTIWPIMLLTFVSKNKYLSDTTKEQYNQYNKQQEFYGYKTPYETPYKTPYETPYKTPYETPYKTPYETPYKTPYETPYNTPYETPYKTPYETPYKTPYETPYKTPYETPYKTPYETPYKTPYETPYKTPYETPYKTPYETPYKVFRPTQEVYYPTKKKERAPRFRSNLSFRASPIMSPMEKIPSSLYNIFGSISKTSRVKR